MQRAHAVVVGAGLAGLTAALRAVRLAGPDAQITVLESQTRLGGQIWTTEEAGFVIERGGEGFVFRSEALPRLAREAGLPDDALIGQSVFTSYGFGAAGLVALAPGEAATYLGFQVPSGDLGRGIRSLRGGMGSLIDALEQALRDAGVELRSGVSVSGVGPTEHGRTRVECADGTRIDAEAVVVATTAASAARVLHPILGREEIAALADAPTLPSVTVELAFERSAVDHPLDGTGFVVATAEQQEGLRACTFTTSKFAGRAPADFVSFRVFFRPEARDPETEPTNGALDDAAWVERALRGLARVVPLRTGSRPHHAWVSRWPNALPVHSPALAAHIAALEPALAAHHVWLAGAAFHGAGIDAAVRSGENAGSQLAARLAPTHPPPP